MKFVDNYLDRITMYRLVLYILLLLTPFGLFLHPVQDYILWSICVVVVSWMTNTLLARVFKTPTNVESVYISALILILLVDPTINIIWLAIIAEASKYLLAINKKHVFNPVAIALVISGSASWWISTIYSLPIVIISGLLIMRKLRKSEMILIFLLVAFSVLLFNGHSLRGYIFNYPVLFFAFVMLTEPLTSPTSRFGKIIYGLLVGILFSQKGISPEIALVIGNVFAYLVSSKDRLIVNLKQKIQLAPNIYEFIFEVNRKLNFLPGQYLEWTIPSQKADSRGNRRYMTIASSPTESDLHLATKYYEKPSTFKKMLFNLDKPVVASQLAGDFVLPRDPNIKLAFVAGGIGITPYRSMIKYLQDTQQVRDIILIYVNKTAEEIVYREVLEYVKTIYVNTSQTGHLNQDTITNYVPDYQLRTWYISGPHNMVSATENLLKRLGIKKIKTDFFPGLV